MPGDELVVAEGEGQLGKRTGTASFFNALRNALNEPTPIIRFEN